ncbi:MAG: hypothetical protein KC910_09320 [Candidatus Eremiobacteraeota bacterium]|nr:hypothetical protein [Candidatus Eremiobacteraeota bacterium]
MPVSATAHKPKSKAARPEARPRPAEAPKPQKPAGPKEPKDEVHLSAPEEDGPNQDTTSMVGHLEGAFGGHDEVQALDHKKVDAVSSGWAGSQGTVEGKASSGVGATGTVGAPVDRVEGSIDTAVESQSAGQRLRDDISKETPPKLSVDEIARLHEQDPAAGNEAITNKYYHQAQELNSLLGGTKDDFNATWPAYGSVASNSAGAVIRSDGIPGYDGISDQVAEGNRKVFKDIAPAYDSYIEAAKKPDFDFAKWMDANHDKLFVNSETGQEKTNLIKSFDYLDRARSEQDEDRKQEYLLASNVLAGRHEQEYLQPQIERATAPLTGTVGERALGEVYVDKDPPVFMPNGKGSGALDQLDVSKTIPGQAPDALDNISDSGVRRDVGQAMGIGNPSQLRGDDVIAASGTENWADLDDRMGTIGGLMVATQNDPRMGEYVLDYDRPAGLSTTGLVESAGRAALDRLTLPFELGKGLFDRLPLFN